VVTFLSHRNLPAFSVEKNSFQDPASDWHIGTGLSALRRWEATSLGNATANSSDFIDNGQEWLPLPFIRAGLKLFTYWQVDLKLSAYGLSILPTAWQAATSYQEVNSLQPQTLPSGNELNGSLSYQRGDLTLELSAIQKNTVFQDRVLGIWDGATTYNNLPFHGNQANLTFANGSPFFWYLHQTGVQLHVTYGLAGVFYAFDKSQGPEFVFLKSSETATVYQAFLEGTYQTHSIGFSIRKKVFFDKDWSISFDFPVSFGLSTFTNPYFQHHPATALRITADILLAYQFTRRTRLEFGLLYQQNSMLFAAPNSSVYLTKELPYAYDSSGTLTALGAGNHFYQQQDHRIITIQPSLAIRWSF